METGEWTTIWDTICERFGRDPSPDLATFYLTELEARLSDDEIRDGVRSVLYGSTYFPSPKEIVDAARDDGGVGIEARAMEQQEVLRDLLSDWRRADLDRLDPIARRAVRSVGGVKQLALTPTADLSFRLRDFRQAYADLAETAVRTPDALPETTDRGRRLVRDAMDGALDAGDADDVHLIEGSDR